MSNRRKTKVAWLDRGWQPVTIGFCASVEAFEAQLKADGHKKSEPPPASADAFIYRYRRGEGYQVVLVVVPERKRDPHWTVELLVHEAVHVWQTIKTEIHEEHPSEEFEAYSLQHITRNLIAAYEDLVGPILRKK